MRSITSSPGGAAVEVSGGAAPELGRAATNMDRTSVHSAVCPCVIFMGRHLHTCMFASALSLRVHCCRGLEAAEATCRAPIVTPHRASLATPHPGLALPCSARFRLSLRPKASRSLKLQWWIC